MEGSYLLTFSSWLAQPPSLLACFSSIFFLWLKYIYSHIIYPVPTVSPPSSFTPQNSPFRSTFSISYQKTNGHLRDNNKIKYTKVNTSGLNKTDRQKEKIPRKGIRNKYKMQRPTHSHTQEFHKNTKVEAIISTQRTCREKGWEGINKINLK